MAALTTILIGAAVAATVAGTAIAYQGQRAQAKAQKQALAIQMQQEETRRQAMNLDANRKKREVLRQQQLLRAQALATAANQGAGGPGSSGIEGAIGQIQGQSGVNQLGINQQQELGNTMFDQNQQITAAGIRAANAGGMVALGTGLSSLGGAVIRNAGTIGRIGGG